MSKTNKPINSFWRFVLILVATGSTGAGLEANTEIQSNLISQANTEQKSRQFESALESKDLEIKKLEKEAQIYDSNEDYRKSIEKWDGIRQLLIKQNQTNSKDYAYTIYVLGEYQLAEGDHEKAEELLEEALRLENKIYGEGSEETAMTLLNLGIAQYEGSYLNNWKKSTINLARACKIIEEKFEANSIELEECHYNLALALFQTRDFNEAEDSINRAIKLRDISDRSSINQANNMLYEYELAKILIDLEKLEKAKEILLRIMSYEEDALRKNLDWSRSAYELSRILGKEGDPVREKELLAQITNILAEEDQEQTVFANKVKNQLGLAHSALGEYGQATFLLREAANGFKNLLGEESDFYAITMSNLGMTLMEQGNPDSAVVILEEAMQIQERIWGNDSLESTSTLHNLASAYHELSKINAKFLDFAKELYHKALEIRENYLPKDHPDIADTSGQLGLLYDDIGDRQNSLMYLERAHKIAVNLYGLKSLESSLRLSNILTTIHIDNHNAEEVKQNHEQVVSIQEEILGSTHPRTLTAYSNAAYFYGQINDYRRYYEYKRKYIDAMSLFIQKEAHFIPVEDRTLFTEYLGLDTFEGIYSDIESESKQEQSSLKLHARLNIHGQLAEIEKRQSIWINAVRNNESHAIKLRSIIDQISQLTTSPEIRLKLEEERRKMERILFLKFPNSKPKIVTTDEVAKSLDDHEVLIEFQRYTPFSYKTGEWSEEDIYAAFMLENNGEVKTIRIGESQVIDDTISKTINKIELQSPDSKKELRQLSRILMQQVYSNLPQGTKTIYISPDGEINRVPFAAIDGPNQEDLLAKSFNIRLLTSGRELLQQNRKDQLSDEKPIIFADPEYSFKLSPKPFLKTNSSMQISSTRSSDMAVYEWSRLPGTAKEAKEIQEIMGGLVYERKRATAQKLKAVISPKILHIASHAFYLPTKSSSTQADSNQNKEVSIEGGQIGLKTTEILDERPLLRSGIALTGANFPNENPNDDGYMTALEMSQMDLRGTDLVVISACESGRGDVLAGEGVYGLKRSIAIAGAKKSLLSLWKVDDRATAAFMKLFYTNIKSNMSPYIALQSTQEKFRSHPIPFWREPYVWAAFQLSGSDK